MTGKQLVDLAAVLEGVPHNRLEHDETMVLIEMEKLAALEEIARVLPVIATALENIEVHLRELR